jgi:hypothetical protein
MNKEFNLKNLILLILVFSLEALLGSCTRNKALIPSKDFGAYYTHIVTIDEFEKYSRTGDYADIVVDLGEENGKFVFWRGSSYLPYWEPAKGERIYADEIIPRSGDGSKTMPDKVNTFSVAKIIENSASKVVVHWRYLPVFGKGNPRSEVISTNFVDEYFTFSPDGTVRRTIKQGTPKFDDWADPKFQHVQTFKLRTKSITDEVLTRPERSLKLEKVAGRALIRETVVEPVAWLKFDEAIGDTTYESLSNSGMEVKGTKTYWRTGISGTCLQFDDVSTVLSLPASAAPRPESAITLEGWISIGAYPWSWCPIVQQADDVPEELLTDDQAGNMGIVFKTSDVKYKKEDDKGYFLGIDGYGHPGIKIRVGGNWEELTSDLHMERRNWYHIAGTYDKSSGKIFLFVNGKLAGEKKVANPGNIELSSKNLLIGRGKDRRPTDPVRGNTFPDFYSFDGLLDEIKIYDQALTQEQIQKSFDNYRTTPDMLASSDIPPRVLPTGEKTDKFGVQYSALRYFDTWDNLFRFSEGADVVVSLGDNPSKFVFWRGVSYIPMIVNEKNAWYSNEFNETWDKSGGHGCQEPMSDKSSDYSHVRVLENTPARVVVQWRFSLLDVNHVLANYNDTTGWSDWSDWYYYIYPDGVAAKKMQLWTNGERNHQFQESMAIFGPDQHPHDIVERTKTVTMLAEDGKYKEYDWQNSPPKNVKEPKNSNIQLINFKGDYDPFTIGPKFEKTGVYDGELTPYAVFCTWNHWPVAQMPSDGRYASYPDRTSHSTLTHVILPIFKEVYGDKPYYEELMLEGMWNKKSTDLIPLSKSWTHAPGLTNLRSAEGGYDISQRAYVLKVSGNSVSFTVNASAESPIQNLCFVLNGWESKDDVKVNISGNVKQGTIRDTDGTYTKVIYIEKEGIVPLKISISK